jgi:hypothetical protein
MMNGDSPRVNIFFQIKKVVCTSFFNTFFVFEIFLVKIKKFIHTCNQINRELYVLINEKENINDN